MNKTYVRDFYGRILGSIEEDTQGNKTARDFYGRIVGRYNKLTNKTSDFYGRIVGHGDILSSLIPKNI